MIPNISLQPVNRGYETPLHVCIQLTTYLSECHLSAFPVKGFAESIKKLESLHSIYLMIRLNGQNCHSGFEGFYRGGAIIIYYVHCKYLVFVVDVARRTGQPSQWQWCLLVETASTKLGWQGYNRSTPKCLFICWQHYYYVPQPRNEHSNYYSLAVLCSHSTTTPTIY